MSSITENIIPWHIKIKITKLNSGSLYQVITKISTHENNLLYGMCTQANFSPTTIQIYLFLCLYSAALQFMVLPTIYKRVSYDHMLHLMTTEIWVKFMLVYISINNEVCSHTFKSKLHSKMLTEQDLVYLLVMSTLFLHC